jgi:hypothetical protein
VGNRKNKRKLDNRPHCSHCPHCHKPGHCMDSCWENEVSR